ncbi:helix-turn-helix domain-containing protein [Planctomicrobium sp.]|nr:helix-turn-helix domain-containing protein [Planctomicrobium sp.]MDB4733494.1 helix-turn-helix domain-containing protein [Planctomicrobium sp.]
MSSIASGMQQDLPNRDQTVLISVLKVSELLGCSQRHVYRLCDSELMPQPIRLRSLVRWNRVELEDWIAQGCPPVPYGQS